MRWKWDFLGDENTLSDTCRDICVPGAPGARIRVVREVNTGMPPNNNVTEDKVQSNAGRVWLFNYLDQRELRLTLELYADVPGIGFDNIVLARRIVNRWFVPEPTAADGVLTCETLGETRALNCRPGDNLLQWDWLYTDQGTYIMDLRLLSTDTLWYDPELQEAVFGGSGESLVLCYELPHTLCSGIGATQQVTNAGDWKTFPIIAIDGPASDVTIQNTSTGEVIGATYSIGAGKTVTYDLTPGIKTVTDSDGNNLIGDLIQPNDLANFHLASQFEEDGEGNKIAPGGVNDITISTPASVTVATMTWYNRYITS